MKSYIEILLCQVMQSIIIVKPHKSRHKVTDNECSFSLQCPLKTLDFIGPQNVGIKHIHRCGFRLVSIKFNSHGQFV